MTMLDTKRLAKIMKALAHEHRLALYLGIAHNNDSEVDAECSVREVAKALTLTAPTICHHLKELVNADLIVTEKRGKCLVARVNRDTLAEVEQVLVAVRSG
ncbi:MAG: helix-turn-helix domain-containing protein [Vicinamibacterales bacterium]|jgi:DNA-binding transcriptional ArsR family regulator|nr:helix-turn-helix domain-containing protein [Vicinamibacterales bacterium]